MLNFTIALILKLLGYSKENRNKVLNVISAILAAADMGSDIAVIVVWYVQHKYWLASIMSLIITVGNILAQLTYNNINGTKKHPFTKKFMDYAFLFDLGTVGYTILFWNALNKDSTKLATRKTGLETQTQAKTKTTRKETPIDSIELTYNYTYIRYIQGIYSLSKLYEIVLESMMCGAFQLFVVINISTNKIEYLTIISIVLSIIRIGNGVETHATKARQAFVYIFSNKNRNRVKASNVNSNARREAKASRVAFNKILMESTENSNTDKNKDKHDEIITISDVTEMKATSPFSYKKTDNDENDDEKGKRVTSSVNHRISTGRDTLRLDDDFNFEQKKIHSGNKNSNNIGNKKTDDNHNDKHDDHLQQHDHDNWRNSMRARVRQAVLMSQTTIDNTSLEQKVSQAVFDDISGVRDEQSKSISIIDSCKKNDNDDNHKNTSNSNNDNNSQFDIVDQDDTWNGNGIVRKLMSTKSNSIFETTVAGKVFDDVEQDLDLDLDLKAGNTPAWKLESNVGEDVLNAYDDDILKSKSKSESKSKQKAINNNATELTNKTDNYGKHTHTATFKENGTGDNYDKISVDKQENKNANEENEVETLLLVNFSTLLGKLSQLEASNNKKVETKKTKEQEKGTQKVVKHKEKQQEQQQEKQRQLKNKKKDKKKYVYLFLLKFFVSCDFLVRVISKCLFLSIILNLNANSQMITILFICSFFLLLIVFNILVKYQSHGKSKSYKFVYYSIVSIVSFLGDVESLLSMQFSTLLWHYRKRLILSYIICIVFAVFWIVVVLFFDDEFAMIQVGNVQIVFGVVYWICMFVVTLCMIGVWIKNKSA